MPQHRLYPPEQNRISGPFSKDHEQIAADIYFQLVIQIVVIIAYAGTAEGLVLSFRPQRKYYSAFKLGVQFVLQRRSSHFDSG